jgi:uncharacterized membrane protein
MATRTRSIRPWHRPLIVLASVVAVGLVLAGVYEFLFAGAGANAEVRLLSGSSIGAAGVSGQGTLEGASGFRLCNKTASRVGVAIGYKDNEGWTTEGWWNVSSRSCETLLRGALVARYYYIYAVDYDRGGEWSGKAYMCSREKEFTIRGTENCLARGYDRTGFFEVDTSEQRSWTVQLTDAAEQTPERPLPPRAPLGLSRPPTTLSPPPPGGGKQ